jgi:hypothetical protein
VAEQVDPNRADVVGGRRMQRASESGDEDARCTQRGDAEGALHVLSPHDEERVTDCALARRIARHVHDSAPTIMVDEPPPSKFIACHAPIRRMSAASSTSVIPTLFCVRPSTTSRKSVELSREKADRTARVPCLGVSGDRALDGRRIDGYVLAVAQNAWPAAEQIVGAPKPVRGSVVSTTRIVSPSAMACTSRSREPGPYAASTAPFVGIAEPDDRDTGPRRT